LDIMKLNNERYFNTKSLFLIRGKVRVVRLGFAKGLGLVCFEKGWSSELAFVAKDVVKGLEREKRGRFYF
jgi:hypothetical protein